MAALDKDPSFILRSRSPVNGGPPLEQLGRSFVTPLQLFFVRNHGPIPEVDPARYRLTVDGGVRRSLTLSLEQLRREFSRKSVTATLQCAGNRRVEFLSVAPVPGEVPWGAEAVGTARWTGVALRDVLLAAGVEGGARHVAFTGLDETEKGGRRFGFGGSIPLEKALSSEVLLAWEMNGGPLPPAHGFPLRVVVPGFVGARSVKWLSSLTLQPTPSSNYFQARAYRLFPPEVRARTADWARGRPLEETCVNAVICRPADGEASSVNPAQVTGYAVAGGGRTIRRVDLTSDGGRTWTTAGLVGEEHPWAWRFWEAHLPLAPGLNEVAARAWDSAGSTQPEEVRAIWNFKGYMNNAWHRIGVRHVGRRGSGRGTEAAAAPATPSRRRRG